MAAALLAGELRPGECVAVGMDKGWQQVVGVLGVLLAGGAYLPVEIDQPAVRRAQILADAGVRHLVVTSASSHAGWPGGLAVVDVDTQSGSQSGSRSASQSALQSSPAAPRSPDDLAYVIYTSGSTGRPRA